MGVPKLWPELKSAEVKETLEKVAFEVFDNAFTELNQGNKLDRSKLLGLRVGVDASAWFYHSNEAKVGANPEIRNLFFRLGRLARCGVLALFVFDGPHRPQRKRGQKVPQGEHKFQRDFIRIVNAFGYEWRVAPGEAEAELAMLNATGIIDLVITDDVDCLLFGADKIMKDALKDKDKLAKEYPCIYERCQIEHEMEITVPGLILVALMSGGDYDLDGLPDVGAKTALALARGGFGDRLAAAVKGLSGQALNIWLQDWRNEIRYELRTNERGLLSQKAGAMAKKIVDSWPNVNTIKLYYDPVTSKVPKYASFRKEHTWANEIQLGALVQIMDEFFEYTHGEILKKLRNLFWSAIVIHHLIRSLHDYSLAPSGVDLSPSKKLAAELSTLSFSPPVKTGSSTPSDILRLPRHILALFNRIEKKRNYQDICTTQELQLIVNPSSLVKEATSFLRFPDPNIGKLEERKAVAAAEKRAALKPGGGTPSGPAKARNSIFVEPNSELRMWIQESLLRMTYPKLVVDWEEREKAKADKKGKKGTMKSIDILFQASKTKTSSRSGKQRQPISGTSLALSASDCNAEDQDIFGSIASALSSEVPDLAKASTISGTVKSKPGRARKASPILSDSSDIEIVPSLKSPRKSPRRSHDQSTARSNTSLSSASANAAASKPSTTSNNVKLASSYRDISDSSEEDSDDSLPSWPSLPTRPSAVSVKTTAISNVPSRSSSTYNTSATLKSEPFLAVASKTSVPVTATSNRQLKKQLVDIIDLCSSD